MTIQRDNVAATESKIAVIFINLATRMCRIFQEF